MFSNPYFHQIAGALLSVIIVHAMGMGVSQAGDGTFSPKISGNIAFEFQNDLAFSSDDEAEEFNNLFTKIENFTTQKIGNKEPKNIN